MYIRVLDEMKIEKDLWVKKQTCKECDHFTNFHLFKVKHIVSMLFFKIFSKTEKYLLVCDNCKKAYEIDKATYKSLRKQQLEKLKNNMVDRQIVLSDFSPKETQFHKKKFKYILSIIWLVFSIIGTLRLSFFYLLIKMFP